MLGSMIDRRNFLTALGMASVAPAVLGVSGTPAAFAPLAHALVLSGGGARGSYEAGIIAGLAAKAGVSDGVPLAPYDIVCGTSIGALNGWFVATGQYTRLRDCWYGISGANITQLKPQFVAARDPQSGILNRLGSAIALSKLTKNEGALLQSKPIFDWISANVDPSTPVLIPLLWAATNLTTQRAEYFYIKPPHAPASLSDDIVASLRITLGPHTAVREVTPDVLHRAIFASAAIPLAFDPVVMPGIDGSPCSYCDGGVTANTPVSVAHAVAAAADIIMMDPAFHEESDLDDALSIGFGMFGTMQRRLLVTEIRTVYFQTKAKQAFERLSASELSIATNGDPQLQSFVATVPATTIAYMRPKRVLPLKTGAFDDEKGIGEAYQLGWSDAFAGFTPYDWETFEM
jgi:predicted acylesterase/phospholipase RssA